MNTHVDKASDPLSCLHRHIVDCSVSVVGRDSAVHCSFSSGQVRRGLECGSKMDESAVIIREARREDCQSIINLSKEIANFHKHFNSPQVDAKVLERDTFDLECPNMGFYVAVIDNTVIGYAHYYYTYTVRLGRNMCLQDLYVQEKFRNHRVGDKLMHAIAKKAVEQNVDKMEFIVTDWNRAKSFYKRKGAIDYTEKENFHLYLFDKAALEKMASA
ncbi:PREDICTED: diamine acetyltransferase 2-like [Ceratosolen solmsi marchali]|uniref:Diamine acetyltransferase 2-like n=1 Tax=Ceratosolen solmsi marchali TaxID=326594 RepID=A0AAJ6YVA6_9HYME|nr:PREDICTED: diamine acetyltransferase 2-like [Ceratosolen solmsi marchali]